MDFLSTERGCALLVGPDDGAPGLESALRAESWECIRSEGPSGVLRRLRTEQGVDMVVLTPGETLDSSYTELCREIKLDRRTAFVPVVFVLSVADVERAAEAYESGADDCISSAVSPTTILVRLANALRIKRATDSLEDSTAVITSLATAIEGRDAYTHGHVERVSAYAVEIGRRVGVDAAGRAALRFGGIVHDIGKVAIPDSILNKPGRLNDIEMELVKRHPLIGHDILKPSRTFRDVLPIVRWHHERPNGKGYPDGLAGDELPLLPRIVAVADVFDAISTSRPYRAAMPPEKCREILSRDAEDGNLDAELVSVLLAMQGQSVPTLTEVIPQPVTI